MGSLKLKEAMDLFRTLPVVEVSLKMSGRKDYRDAAQKTPTKSTPPPKPDLSVSQSPSEPSPAHREKRERRPSVKMEEQRAAMTEEEEMQVLLGSEKLMAFLQDRDRWYTVEARGPVHVEMVNAAQGLQEQGEAALQPFRKVLSSHRLTFAAVDELKRHIIELFLLIVGPTSQSEARSIRQFASKSLLAQEVFARLETPQRDSFAARKASKVAEHSRRRESSRKQQLVRALRAGTGSDTSDTDDPDRAAERAAGAAVADSLDGKFMRSLASGGLACPAAEFALPQWISGAVQALELPMAERLQRVLADASLWQVFDAMADAELDEIRDFLRSCFVDRPEYIQGLQETLSGVDLDLVLDQPLNVLQVVWWVCGRKLPRPGRLDRRKLVSVITREGGFERRAASRPPRPAAKAGSKSATKKMLSELSGLEEVREFLGSCRQWNRLMRGGEKYNRMVAEIRDCKEGKDRRKLLFVRRALAANREVTPGVLEATDNPALRVLAMVASDSNRVLSMDRERLIEVCRKEWPENEARVNEPAAGEGADKSEEEDRDRDDLPKRRKELLARIQAEKSARKEQRQQQRQQGEGGAAEPALEGSLGQEPEVPVEGLSEEWRGQVLGMRAAVQRGVQQYVDREMGVAKEGTAAVEREMRELRMEKKALAEKVQLVAEKIHEVRMLLSAAKEAEAAVRARAPLRREFLNGKRRQVEEALVEYLEASRKGEEEGVDGAEKGKEALEVYERLRSEFEDLVALKG